MQKIGKIKNVTEQNTFVVFTPLDLCTPINLTLNVEKPFLKWAGRKTKLVNALKPFLPKNAKRFIEPFVGSGAVFINTHYTSNILSDSNEDIISLFRILKKEKGSFIRRCQKLFIPENNTAEKFYEFREEFNNTDDVRKRASIFVYLNRHCFNGLCRYNKSGKFNTPFGQYEKPYFPHSEMLAFAQKLETATLISQDFRKSLAEAKYGDVVYCDPPYVPLSETAYFTDYATGGFGIKDQQDLAEYCSAAAMRGATVIISNHDTPVTRALYKSASEIISTLVSRTISCDGQNRNKVKELIAVFDKAV